MTTAKLSSQEVMDMISGMHFGYFKPKFIDNFKSTNMFLSTPKFNIKMRFSATREHNNMNYLRKN